MAKVKFCLDTHALAEIKQENPNFDDLVSLGFLITDLTLADFYARLLREEGEKSAEYWRGRLTAHCISVPREILIDGVKFQQQHRESGIRLSDAVAYLYAVANDFVFVTLNKTFKELPHVAFRDVRSAPAD